MEKVHFSTYLSFFQTSGSSELYRDNEIFVKQFKLFFFLSINQKTFSKSYKDSRSPYEHGVANSS